MNRVVRCPVCATALATSSQNPLLQSAIGASNRSSSVTTFTMQSSHNLVFADPLKPVKLDDFRNVLIRQEETIIFALIERAQFPRNSEVYVKRKQRCVVLCE